MFFDCPLSLFVLCLLTFFLSLSKQVEVESGLLSSHSKVKIVLVTGNAAPPPEEKVLMWWKRIYSTVSVFPSIPHNSLCFQHAYTVPLTGSISTVGGSWSSHRSDLFRKFASTFFDSEVPREKDDPIARIGFSSSMNHDGTFRPFFSFSFSPSSFLSRPHTSDKRLSIPTSQAHSSWESFHPL